ncbi:MAG TPA: DUF2934 domain-containing protein [Blastocatellia bacterium]|nr:DUF2934 domain-containing protein [Blastocatellia bacterium]HMV86258.1 DUF2934 domain-containing protein [Blastocatellia bacterium]HMX26165.1 DUF2934 domain-containing protein [Blastocatellia bacterium]HMY72993.1 DUF2934 domain-containing protein [Blastocatellia bacterium]HMZ18550.1 DUF2934 domain-containing protein [Blastocatellia bacterium]
METYTGDNSLLPTLTESISEEPQSDSRWGAASSWEADLESRISARAYEIYLKRDGGDGDALKDWLQAEAEIRGDNQGVDETEGVYAVDGEAQESYAAAGGL